MSFICSRLTSERSERGTFIYDIVLKAIKMISPLPDYDNLFTLYHILQYLCLYVFYLRVRIALNIDYKAEQHSIVLFISVSKSEISGDKRYHRPYI